MSDDLANQMTPEAYAALEAELEHLETEGRAEIAERIKVARAWGDLKENAEYHDAKNSQAHLETKIQRLRERRRNAVVVEGGTGDGAVAMGSIVSVRDVESGRESTYTIVSANESAPAQGLLGIDSPMGRALAGAREGDEVAFETPRGSRRLLVVSVGT